MSKILIVSPFYLETPISRPYQMRQFFEHLGYKTLVVTTNFNHSTKKFHVINSTNTQQLKVIKYKNTFSIFRIISHFVFAIKVNRFIYKANFDLIYITIPLNLSALLAVRIANKKNKKIIIDLIDLWPPKLSKNILSLLLNIWRSWCNKAIMNSDLTLLETTAYIPYVQKYMNQFAVAYLSKKQGSFKLDNKRIMLRANSIKKQIRILYLGNFSNSYDYDSLLKILISLKDLNPTLVIIGDGYLKKKIKSMFYKSGITIEDYGIVFNEDNKEQIMVNCHFGYNAVKTNVIVGLSYKSIDYLSYGLPLINSIKYDTFEFVSQYNVGFNFNKENIRELINNIKNISINQYIYMSRNAYKLFNDKFSNDIFYKNMKNIIMNKGIYNGKNHSI